MTRLLVTCQSRQVDTKSMCRVCWLMCVGQSHLVQLTMPAQSTRLHRISYTSTNILCPPLSIRVQCLHRQIKREREREREFLLLVTVKECQVDDRMFLPLVTVSDSNFISFYPPLPARYPPTTSSFSVSRWHPSLVLKREKDEQAPDLFSFSCRYFRFFHLVALEPRCLS